MVAAQIEDAPAIIQISHRALQHVGDGNVTLGLRYMAEIGRSPRRASPCRSACISITPTKSEVMQAIALGFTSVMFDGGELPFAAERRAHDQTADSCAFGQCLPRSRDGRSAARR